MATKSTSPLPDDAPNVNIYLPDTFTGKGRKAFRHKVETNRRDPEADFILSWDELLKMPPRPVDAVLQASCYIGLGGFISSFLLALPTVPAWLIVPLAIACFAVSFAAIVASIRNRLLVVPTVYRLTLILFGLLLVVWRIKP